MVDGDDSGDGELMGGGRRPGKLGPSVSIEDHGTVGRIERVEGILCSSADIRNEVTTIRPSPETYGPDGSGAIAAIGSNRYSTG